MTIGAVTGSNVLNLALTVISKQQVTYYRNKGRTVNEVGHEVPSFAAPVVLTGSLQPMQRSAYKELGLDLSKSYYTFWCNTLLNDVKRGVSGDKVVANGREYSVVGNYDWTASDGWNSVNLIDVGAA